MVQVRTDIRKRVPLESAGGGGVIGRRAPAKKSATRKAGEQKARDKYAKKVERGVRTRANKAEAKLKAKKQGYKKAQTSRRRAGAAALAVGVAAGSSTRRSPTSKAASPRKGTMGKSSATGSRKPKIKLIAKSMGAAGMNRKPEKARMKAGAGAAKIKPKRRATASSGFARK